MQLVSLPTEADRDTYYGYNLDLITTVLHNCSLAGLANPQPEVTYSDTHDEVTITRNATEELTMSVDHHHRLILTVCNPQIADAYDEMTAIYLSRREVAALRTLLNHLAEV
jgi:hypothetical protein